MPEESQQENIEENNNDSFSQYSEESITIAQFETSDQVEEQSDIESLLESGKDPELPPRRPGVIPPINRPSRPRLADASPEKLEKLEREVKKKNMDLKKDRLLNLVKDNTSGIDFFEKIIEEFSEEVFSLKHEREKAEAKGKDTSGLSIKRVNALKHLADLWIAKRKLSIDEAMDLKSERFQRVFKFLLTIFRDSMVDSGMDMDDIKKVIQTLMFNLDGWEEKAQELVSGNFEKKTIDVEPTKKESKKLKKLEKEVI